jgi:bifunctional UDP-N-acetylglucosamine pyrophosphorylase/glucosamine-1-phosphate N-acetyltransferase
MSASAIILAAGKSTRMKSRKPKPLHEIAGKPMLGYVLDACYQAGCKHVMVVIGHGKDEVIARFGSDSRITWIEQTEQLGTGHAARMCESALRENKGDVFILAGDGPLIRGEVLNTLLQAHKDEGADATMATAVLDDPTGYGRIVRDEHGEFVAIVEQADCTPEQREIHEVFPSYYCVKSDELLFALSQLKNENAKREYYLTDIYAILRNAGRKVLAVQAVTAEDTLAVNTRMQQAEVDEIMQDRIHRQLREAGVTIVSSEAAYIESDVTIGPDTIIRPFSYIERGASIGRDCVIGPYAFVPQNAIVPEGSTIAGNVSRETSLLEQG